MLKIENLSREALVRLEELANSVNGQITASRISELIRKKDQEEDRKKLIIMILAVVGAIAAAAAIGYAVYRFLTPEYLDDFDDDFDEDFDDAGAEDLEEEAAAEPEAEAEEPAGEEIRTVPDEDAEEV